MMQDSYSPSSPAHSHQTDHGSMVLLRAEQARLGAKLAVWWRRMLLTIMLVEIPLQLDSYIFHSIEDARFGAISGYNFSLTTICLFFLYLQWLPRTIVASTRIVSSKSLMAYVAFVAISILWAVDKDRTLYALFLLLQACLIFVYIINNIKTRTDVIFVMACLTVGLIIEGTCMVLVRVVGQELALGPVVFGMGAVDHRLTGSFGSPNVAASYIAILLAPLLSLLLIPAAKRLKALATFAIAAGILALIMTMSRGGWLAAGFSCSGLCLEAFRRNWISRKVFARVFLLIAVFFMGALPTLANRLFGDDNGSAESRLPLNKASLLLIAEHPLGVGANNWDLAAKRYFEQSQFREEWFFTVHNHYLLVLTELGWLGFLAYLVFLGSIIHCGWRALKRCERTIAPLLLALTAALVGQMFHMAFDIFNSRSKIQMICLTAALIVVCANLVPDRSEEHEAADNRHQDVPPRDRFSAAVTS